jgi:PII-like signaling protein
MQTIEQSELKIYIDNTDSYKEQPLWRYILQSVEESQLKGATVYKAVAGIGSNATLHTFDILNLSNEMPLTIEIIDTDEKITHFLEEHKDALKGLFITKHTTQVVNYN